jgi:subtilisin family serine protease
MRRILSALVIGGAVAVAVPTIAQADIVSDGLWYFDVLHVQDAHDAGFTGDGVTVAVIDSPVNLDVPTLRDANVVLGDQPECFLDGAEVPAETTDLVAAHGTNVVSLIAGTGAENGVKGVAPGADVLYYRVTPSGDVPCEDSAGEQRYQAIAEAIDSAVAAGADIISTSLGFGPGDGIREAMARAIARDVIVVSALSNQDGDLLDSVIWSAYLNGGVSVQAIGRDGAVQTHVSGLGDERAPNTDPDVDIAAPGIGILYQGTPEQGFAGQTLTNGNSFATPIVAGFLAVTAQKYPAATGNQLLQSLILNTGDGDHPLTYDPNRLIGYGFASLTNMLEDDPAQYPDVNPLIVPDGEPTAEEIAAAVPTPSATPVDPGPAPGGGFPMLLVVVGVAGIVVLAVVAVIVLVVVRTSRSRRGES